RRQRLETLDELPHDAEDPPGVLDGEVQHRVPARWLQDALLQRVSTGAATRHDRTRFPAGQTSALLGAIGQAVLAQVVGEVAGIDAEQPRRLLAHAARAALRLQEQVALQPRQRV